MAIRTLFKRIILLTAAVLLCIGLGVGTLGNLSHKSYLAALIIAILMAVSLTWIIKNHPGVLTVFDRFSPPTVCAAVTVLCLLLNGLWVFCFQPVQAPDYRTFYEAALNLSEGNQLVNQDYISMFPHILGYAAFLSIFLLAFGQNILTAAILNVLLTGASGVLIYVLTLCWTGKRSAAAIIGFLWAVCPSKLLYNTMALSEPYYTFHLLLFLLLSSLAVDCSQRSDSRERGKKATSSVLRAVVLGLLGGLILALINSARPIGLIPIIALLIWLLLLRKNSDRIKRMGSATYLVALLVTYILAGQAWNTYAATKLGQAPPSVPGYSIYVGFNPETRGSYADGDMELLQGRYFGEYDRNADAAQRSMLESAKDRIRETKSSIPTLMIHKLGTLLGHDEGGAFYSSESLSARAYVLWCVASNIWYYFVCILALAGGVRLWGKKWRDDSLWLVPLCLVGVILAQLLVEVAARYHYCLIPLLLLMAGLTIEPSKKPG